MNGVSPRVMAHGTTLIYFFKSISGVHEFNGPAILTGNRQDYKLPLPDLAGLYADAVRKNLGTA